MSTTFSIDGRYVTYNLFNTYKWAKSRIGEKPTAGAYPPEIILYKDVFHPPGLMLNNILHDATAQIFDKKMTIQTYGVSGEMEIKDVSDPVVGGMIDYLVNDEAIDHSGQPDTEA